MKTIIQSCELTISHRRKYLAEDKPLAGRILVNDLDNGKATFDEWEGATVICGEPKSRRVLQGKTCSVWWNPEKERYTIRISVAPNMDAAMLSECDYEECIAYVKRKIRERHADTM